MTPRERVEEALRARGGKHSGSNWTCPAHEDSSPSLSVGEGEEGNCLLNCHHGCRIEEIVAALGLSMSDLFDSENRDAGRRIVAEYDYLDADGQLSYQVVRFEPKDFRQRRPDGAGGWVWNLRGVSRVLYRLPEILDAISLGETIYLVEGEKDVHALESVGVVATTNAGGAGKWDDSFTLILANATKVELIADNDAPGIAHMETVSKTLNGTPNRVLKAKKGKDAYDHLVKHGLGVKDFVKLGAADVAVVATSPRGEVAAPDADDEREPTKPEKILPSIVSRNALSYVAERVLWLTGYEGLIPMRMVTMLAGLPGLGKSMLVCHVAASETQHGRTVCIAAAEDSIEHVLIPRLVAAGANLKHVEFLEYTDEAGDGPIQLPDHGNILRTRVLACAPSFFAVDPIGSFMGRGVDAWKATDVRAALGPFKTIAEEASCACLLVAHLNKGTGAYLNRVSDSAAFGQLVRSGLLFGRDPLDPEGEAGVARVLVSGKLNVGVRPSARAYKMVPAWIPSPDGTPPDIATARLEYTGDSKMQTDDLLDDAKQAEPSAETAEAIIMLKEFLTPGPRSSGDIKDEAKTWGMSMTPVYKASTRIGVIVERLGYQKGTQWRLP